MTIQQEATNLIYSLPDENVKLIVDVMRKMLTPVIEGIVKNKYVSFGMFFQME